ncbi:E3 ubiquitin protein ligase DRIP2-like [Impatiens glandulifera]|uniref:E3 ubiquitin protein ligase DRIP2-like n=1 Tax=Impatiens glandulifera TaxID=253017 RepID=UPI001FB06081|nr:E3 ubiquitin protein ligase DRIP2-like [Impatiens glandulifera]
MSSQQVAEVKTATILSCMTCPLCDKLFREATTIIECLHTFCRKCIYKKLDDEELECCPICNIDLGCAPLEKLRPDHSLQDMRAKLFPFDRRKMKAPELVHSITTLPAKRKERSLSSLVVTPIVSSSHGQLTGKRSKPVGRKASSSRFTSEKHAKKVDDYIEDDEESSSSPESIDRSTQHFRQNSVAETSRQSLLEKETENSAESREVKVDLWKSLNCLVEAANRTKFSNYQESTDKTEPLYIHNNNDGQSWRSKAKFKVPDDPVSLDSVQPKKLRRIQPKKAAASARDMLDSISGTVERRNSPIWFSLMPAEGRDGLALPQIRARYLRIRDGSMTVSFIKKYIAKKLDLTSDVEVEIKCMGQTVIPTLQLNHLVDLWVQSMPTSKSVPALIGSSAKEFVMVLTYARQAPPS